MILKKSRSSKENLTVEQISGSNVFTVHVSYIPYMSVDVKSKTKKADTGNI